MATLDASDIDKYAFDFEELEHVPDAVIDEMLSAEGKIIREGQASSAASMLQGPYYQGAVAGAPRMGKVKKTNDGKAMFITFEGEQHGNRIAEIAFVNEYGKHGQMPRPFIRTANEKNAEAAVNAAAKVYDEYLKTKGF